MVQCSEMQKSKHPCSPINRWNPSWAETLHLLFIYASCPYALLDTAEKAHHIQVETKTTSIAQDVASGPNSVYLYHSKLPMKSSRHRRTPLKIRVRLRCNYA
ncbi:hypothetical protein SeMB42_g03909 [Synchytrium endobioticum]|uniref:Uncharacterized protein n=1 Tax=Synchytrium endobioticum TaxID=286115 RepID=A0A507D2Q7_9FUNG|nr:hypothetical protein SeMB42_g03909 [Synchytrium endobioticum]